MTPSPGIVWFRRDLRLHDHPALRAAEADGAVLPLFVVDPGLVHGRFGSVARTSFLLRSVATLRQGLRALGSDLVVRVGDPREVVPEFAAGIGAAGVHVSREHAPYGRTRDAAVAAELEVRGVAWHGHRGGLVHEPEAILTAAGQPFSVFSPFRRAWSVRPLRAVVDAPSALPPLPPGVDPGAIPSLADLGLPTGAAASLDVSPEPGEPAARRRLDRWVAGGLAMYAATRDRLDLADGTSRLSADLHLGLLSPLEVVVRTAGPGDDRRAFTTELIWREFYAHALFYRPSLRSVAFHAAFDAIPWSDDEWAREAWRDGRTGYPIVDAAMRQLLATGWMPNRGRMVTASFLTKDLLIDWRHGEAHFMRHLVDGDVASNNGGWQWAASTGTDPQPYVRIFNPVLQGRRFDPDGAYVRRWVPELAGVPTARIHAPWEMTDDEAAAAGCRIGRDYPAPIVDHAQARARALAVYDAARRTS